jgi:hypothetical protein
VYLLQHLPHLVQTGPKLTRYNGYMDNLLLAIQVTEPAAKLLKQSVEMHLQCCKSDEERKLLETLNIKLKGCLLEYRFHRHN